MSNTSVIVHDIRSTHNVGSILRTCDGFGVVTVYIGGYTPYPTRPGDTRLPHISTKLTRDIAKTALGAEQTANIILYDDLSDLIHSLQKSDTSVIALEQSTTSANLADFDRADMDIALLLGREVEGIDREILAICDHTVEIPMRGQKESFNVSVAAAIALYELAR
jgi:23S rRNA (guanosine2251-2'-O)-methyltransferase